MEILLNDDEKLIFTWRNSGVLTIQKWTPGADTQQAWVLAGTTTLQEDQLINFIEGLAMPILRRCMQFAVRWQDTWGGKKS